MSNELSRRSLLTYAGLLTASALLPIEILPAFAEDGTPVPGGTLSMWLPEPPLLNSAVTSAGQAFNSSNKIFDGLVEYGFDMTLKPKLATEWSLSDDARTLTFKLRDDVKWHDGEPFTARDLQFTALEIWKKVHPRGRLTWAGLETVETPDDHTAVMRFSKPAPYILNALHGAEAQVLPRHVYEGTDPTTNPANVAPIGNGPFRFVEWQRGDYILLQKNPDYWDSGKPYFDQLIFKIIPDTSARSVALEAQEIQIAGAIPVSLPDARRLEALPYIEIPEHGGEAQGQIIIMEINARRAPLDNPVVRKAMLHAIDRDYLLKNIMFDFGKVSTGPVPYTQSQFYTPDVATYEFDVDKANRMLDEAGLKRGADGIRFRITNDFMPQVADVYAIISQFFKQQMAAVGIEVSVRNQDFASYVKRIYTDSDFDTTVGTFSGLSDPTIGIQRFYWSKNIKKGAPYSNASNYSNPEVDRCLEQAQVEADPAKRVALLQEFQRLVMQDVPIFSLIDAQYFAVKNTKLVGTEESPYGISDNFAGAYFKA